MKPKLAIVFLIIWGYSTAQMTSQDEQQLDSIFSEWKNNDRPGMAAGLIYGNKVKRLKAYGLADIENNRPITPQTKFQVDHLSRQFAILAILILEQKGELSLQDSVQKYVPNLPNYVHPLLIRHLMNHSSGLNDYEVIKGLLGIGQDHVFTHEDALRLIYGQKKLNYIPGTDFSYITSKTELTLLAEVIMKATGVSLSEFTKEHIFQPLKMTNTLFVDDYNSIVDNVANSYQATDDNFKRKVLNQSNVGPSNLYTSAEDLQKWYIRFSEVSDDDLTKLIQKLDFLVVLENGDTYNSAWGQMTLGRSFYHKERGLPAYWQYGLVGGYGANVFRFPEQKLTSFVLGNNDSYNGYPAMMQANHFIESEYPEPSVAEVPKVNFKDFKNNYKKIEGQYWNPKRGLARRVYFSNDTLFYARLGQERGLPLIPFEKENSFQLQVESDDKIYFTFKEEQGQQIYESISGGSSPTRFIKYDPASPTDDQLQAYVGRFYQPNLACIYSFEIKDGKLIALGPTGRKIELSPVTKDVFRSTIWSLAGVQFERDAKDEVIAFKINTDGIKNLDFLKIN